MKDEYASYLAVFAVTESDTTTVRLGHFVGWLFEQEGYSLIADFGLTRGVKTEDYDRARIIAKQASQSLELELVDAVSQFGTAKKQKLSSRTKDKVLIDILSKATKQVQAINERLKTRNQNR